MKSLIIYRLLCLVGILGIALSGLFSFNPFVPDSFRYIEFARDLPNQIFPQQGQSIDLYRTPGYPLFIWLVSFTPETLFPLAIKFLQILLIFINASLLCRIFNQIVTSPFDRIDCFLTFCVIMLIDCAYFTISFSILSEPLLATLLLGTAACLLIKSNKPWHLFWRSLWIGLLCGFGSIIKPVMILFSLPVIITIFTLNIRRRQKAYMTGIVVTCSLLVSVSWVERNKKFSNFSGFSTVTYTSLVHYKAASIISEKHKMDVNEVKKVLLAQYPEEPTSDKEARQMRAFAVEEIKNSPILFFKQILKGLLLFSVDSGGTFVAQGFGLVNRGSGVLSQLAAGNIQALFAYLTSLSIATVIILCWSYFVLAAEYAALFFSVKYLAKSHILKESEAFMTFAVFLTLCVLYLMILQAGPETTSRFRAPLLPLTLIIPAIAAAKLHEKSRGGDIVK